MEMQGLQLKTPHLSRCHRKMKVGLIAFAVSIQCKLADQEHLISPLYNLQAI